MEINRKKFNFDEMTKHLSLIFNKHIPEEVKLTLPKLKKEGSNNKLPKLKLPKLKKVTNNEGAVV